MLMPRSLPGQDLIEHGLDDLATGRESVAALVVLVGAPRLRRLGLTVPEGGTEKPEVRLFQKLAEVDPDSAHSRYNALVRRLVSYERAATWTAFAAITRTDAAGWFAHCG